MKTEEITFILNHINSNEQYISEALEMFCHENNFTQQEGLIEILRMGVEEIYGLQRKSNDPFFHEKEYLEEKNSRLENMKKNGRIFNYELNLLKREFVEDRN